MLQAPYVYTNKVHIHSYRHRELKAGNYFQLRHHSDHIQIIFIAKAGHGQLEPEEHMRNWNRPMGWFYDHMRNWDRPMGWFYDHMLRYRPITRFQITLSPFSPIGPTFPNTPCNKNTKAHRIKWESTNKHHNDTWSHTQKHIQTHTHTH